MANCPSCGKDVPAGFDFCGHCGAKMQPVVATTKPGSGNAIITTYGFLISAILGVIGLALLGLAIGIYAIPGYNQSAAYCAYPGSICDQGRSMIVNGVVLGTFAILMWIVASFHLL